MSVQRIGCMNLESGGIREGNDDKFWAAVDFLQGCDLSALLLQEAKWTDRDHAHTDAMATKLGMVPVSTTLQGRGHTGHGLVTFYNPDVFARHGATERGHPFWHVRLSATFRPKDMPDVPPLKLVNRHGPPFDPEGRLQEARYDVGFSKHNAILGGDWNCIAPDDPELVWQDWQRWQSPRREEREYQALVDQFGEFILGKDGKPMADRRPALVLNRNGLLDAGAYFKDRRATAGLDGSLTGPRRIDRFHASKALFENGFISGYGLLDDGAQALTFTDHLPIYLDIAMDKWPAA